MAGKPSTCPFTSAWSLVRLASAFGVETDADTVSARAEQVELGLDSKNTARPNNDSPVNVWENLYDLAPKRPENPHASNFECDLDAALGEYRRRGRRFGR